MLFSLLFLHFSTLFTRQTVSVFLNLEPGWCLASLLTFVVVICCWRTLISWKVGSQSILNWLSKTNASAAASSPSVTSAHRSPRLAFGSFHTWELCPHTLRNRSLWLEEQWWHSSFWNCANQAGRRSWDLWSLLSAYSCFLLNIHAPPCSLVPKTHDIKCCLTTSSGELRRTTTGAHVIRFYAWNYSHVHVGHVPRLLGQRGNRFQPRLFFRSF